MRICLVSQEYPPGRTGGIGTQTRVKALGLARLGHDVEVLTAGEEHGPQLIGRLDEDIRIHAMRLPGADVPVLHTEAFWLAYSWSVFEALRHLQAARHFDVIDFPDYAAEGFAYLLDRPADDSAAVVIHLHGSLAMFAEQIGWPDPDARLHKAGIFMEDFAIAAADGLIAASESIAGLTASRLELAPDHIALVAGGVDTATFSPRQREPERPLLLFVGSLAENKGSQVVLEAFIALSDRHPDLSLCLAGAADDDNAERLYARASAAGVIERVRIAGFVEHGELPALYRAASIFVAPSQYEGGLGMVYLEAMACGLPVIGRARGGAAEAIVPWETGILLDQGDVAELTGALSRLLADERLRLCMGAAGLARVRASYGAAAYAGRVELAYAQALGRRHVALEEAAA